MAMNVWYRSRSLTPLLAVFCLTACSTLPTSIPDTPFWAPGLGSAANRFELAKRSEPELTAFLRRFPKGADLHNHGGGATYSDYLLDGARAAGWRYDPDAVTFVPAGEGTISIDALEKDTAELKRFFETISMRGWYPNTASGHNHFFETFRHISPSGRTPASLIAELVTRNRYQNVNYLELMLNPLPRGLRREFTKAGAGLDPDNLDSAFARFDDLLGSKAIDETIVRALDSLDAAIGQELGSGPSAAEPATTPVHVRYLGSLMRVGPLDAFFSDAVAVFAGMRADNRIVGLNIVAPEDHPQARRDFQTQMRMLDFLWKRFDKPNITLHAGELTLVLSPVESMWDRIRTSIDTGHARRIGHGISVGWERDLPGLLAQMRRDGVMVEINLSSNESILGVEGHAHPLPMYLRAGVPVCITTDDEGVSRSNLTAEYVKAVEQYNLSYTTLKRISRNCLEYSFLPGESLYEDRDYKRRRSGFAEAHREDWKPGAAEAALIKANPRLARQVLLERAFAEFESTLDKGFRE